MMFVLRTHVPCCYGDVDRAVKTWDTHVISLYLHYPLSLYLEMSVESKLCLLLFCFATPCIMYC